MCILFVVAVSTVNRIMENTRKNTFIDTVKQYTNGAKTMWAADNLQLDVTDSGMSHTYLSFAMSDGKYYIKDDSKEVETSTTGEYPHLLDDGGKSSWGKRYMLGYILINVIQKNTRT